MSTRPTDAKQRKTRQPTQHAEKTVSQQASVSVRHNSQRRHLLLLLLGVLLLVFVAVIILFSDEEEKETVVPSKQRTFVQTADFARKKELFLQQYADKYGYNGKLDMIRKTQTPQLTGEIYFDYTGSGVYQKKQIEAVIKDLEHNLYGNPHSINPSSSYTDKVIKEMRKLLLSYFNADPTKYTVIFTSGTTGALKIVGETFPWTNESRFVYTKANHNSVLGIREYALNKGAKFECMDPEELSSSAAPDHSSDAPSSGTETNNLFAFPAECNYSGKKYSLDLIHQFHNGTHSKYPGKYWVLLDAAAFVPTSRLDLTKYPADFVAISFYKMFGYPSGLGALIVTTEAAMLLKKSFFSGGTVSLSLSEDDFYQWMPDLCTRFEDGTLPFLSIAALKYGFQVIEEVGGIDAITAHTFSLSDWMYSEMQKMRHSNGRALFEMYSDHSARNPTKQGPILNFNLLDSEGEYIGFFDVSVLASENHIHFRTGCTCNPGACYASLNVPSSLIKGTVAKIAHNSCGERLDIVSGQPVGSIRVSIGYLSTIEEADAILQFFHRFLNKTNQQIADEFQLTRSEK